VQINVAELLKEVVLLFESEAILKGCDIRLDPIEPELDVCVDVKQMKHVLLNIVKNSLEAMEQSGHGMIRISASKQGADAAILVQDNGTGMDYHTQAKLFDPFFTTKEEGTGLGLAVCYRIVRNHGGRIDVASVPGDGTSFKITLPLCG